MLIEPGFESPTCGSNVNFGVAIFRCNFGFIDCFFFVRPLFPTGQSVFFLQLHGSVSVEGFVQNTFVMAVN